MAALVALLLSLQYSFLFQCRVGPCFAFTLAILYKDQFFSSRAPTRSCPILSRESTSLLRPLSANTTGFEAAYSRRRGTWATAPL
ncbi:uncharacterized protein BDZ99DRAFT_461565 [Mytilinidion resinicola]|uniref:Secreted protein n=1 Tax=Mytilinidion resinicola TaxID=574789 RepID=A0A6A6YUA1_9PEZI|nr:uncharacterized protein BDZ99DRAFT_461565 [Mytilinidion resinicola]KAF2811507.1 hypothetical protein BDZ99DRAFT_461565 [Mytilinidion resinicola]